MFACQVLSKEQYACWLRRHLEAETAIQGREELLFDSALRLETNLQLLGEPRRSLINEGKCHGMSLKQSRPSGVTSL